MMRESPELLENPVDGVLASPLIHTATSYLPAAPVTVTPAGTTQRVTNPRNTLLAPVESTGLMASLGLTQSASLTGGKNSPGTPAAANSPGLESGAAEEESARKGAFPMHWGWIALIAVVVLGLLWYSQNQSTSNG